MMETRSGHKLHPINMKPGDINIFDIAESLAKLCRFNGHCKGFYSVAEHCVRSYWYARDIGAHSSGGGMQDQYISQWAFLHDAFEAYFFDAVRPVKSNLYINLPATVCLQLNIPDKYLLQDPDHAVIGIQGFIVPISIYENAILNHIVAPNFHLPPIMGDKHNLTYQTVKLIDNQLLKWEGENCMTSEAHDWSVDVEDPATWGTEFNPDWEPWTWLEALDEFLNVATVLGYCTVNDARKYATSRWYSK